MENSRGAHAALRLPARAPVLQEHDPDFIDMDLTFFSAPLSAPPSSKEFEFKTPPPEPDQDVPAASPADELFYMGKLLPLHLPPRLQMVEKLLDADVGLAGVSTAPSTPFASYDASPATSCYVSGELSAEEYFRECTAGLAAAVEPYSGKRPVLWSKKLKFIKHLHLALKLKASKILYLKAVLLSRPAGNSQGKKQSSPAAAAAPAKGGGCKALHKKPFGHIRSSSHCHSSATAPGDAAHGAMGPRDEDRRSSAIVRDSSSASSSASSSSSSSSECCAAAAAAPAAVLRRSSSASSERDSPIQGAIAYCKKSQQLAAVRKTASDASRCFAVATKVAAEEADGLVDGGICRG